MPPRPGQSAHTLSAVISEQGKLGKHWVKFFTGLGATGQPGILWKKKWESSTPFHGLTLSFASWYLRPQSCSSGLLRCQVATLGPGLEFLQWPLSLFSRQLHKKKKKSTFSCMLEGVTDSQKHQIPVRALLGCPGGPHLKFPVSICFPFSGVCGLKI